MPPFTNGQAMPDRDRIHTEEEKQRMRQAVLNAKSLAEMAKLETDFAEGRIPSHILHGDPMET
jgi:hypothetical protein